MSIGSSVRALAKRTSVAKSDRQLLRGLALAVVGLGLSACMSSERPPFEPQAFVSTPDAAHIYDAVEDANFVIPAVDLARLNPQYQRQTVVLPEDVPNVPGAIVIDPDNRFLYLVGESGEAVRYGIGVGREGFSWSGTATIKRKVEWPTWTPPKEMVERDLKAAQFAEGMPGGLENPLGARAMYLFQNDKDTLYRIHGTNEPWSIGGAVSSGCIRMLNQDVVDLYQRTPEGTEVLVLPSREPSA
jgi:lipoprotein-anchoring transpeptidase ErfK/SrfK